MKSALLQANSILEGMTDPFPGFLLESRVIIDKAQVTNALSSFIDDNSRLEKKTGKRIRHALEDAVGLKQGAFHRLASTTRRVILCAKIVKSVAGDLVQTVQFALADFDKSRLLCKDARYDATQRVLCGLAVSFRRYRQKELCLLIFISNGYPPP